MPLSNNIQHQSNGHCWVYDIRFGDKQRIATARNYGSHSDCLDAAICRVLTDLFPNRQIAWVWSLKESGLTPCSGEVLQVFLHHGVSKGYSGFGVNSQGKSMVMVGAKDYTQEGAMSDKVDSMMEVLCVEPVEFSFKNISHNDRAALFCEEEKDD